MVRTRMFAIITLFLNLVTAGLYAAQPSFPQKFVVDEDDVLVRSGPGEDYYATSALAKGDEVEVLRIDHEQWGAIAPPPGSFSWIESKVLEPSSLKDVRKVREERARTRVGSRFIKDRQVAYVTLQRGDHVKLLEPHSADATENEWIKIAPSKGELRWIPLAALSPLEKEFSQPDDTTDVSPKLAAMHQAPPAETKDVDADLQARDESVDGLDEDSFEDQENLADIAESESIEPIPADRGQSEPPSKVVRAQWAYDMAPRTYDDQASRQEPKNTEKDLQSPPERALTLSQAFGELRQAVNAIHEESISDEPPSQVRVEESLGLTSSDDGWVRPVNGDNEGVAPSENLLPPSDANRPPPPSFATDDSNPMQDPVGPGLVAGSGEAAFQESIRIAAELARVIANADPTTWSLSPLRSRAEAVVDTAGSAEVRMSGQDLIARIAQFEDIQRRHRQLIAAKTVPSVDNAEEKSTDVGFFRRFGNRTLAKGNDRLPNSAVDPSRYDGYGWLMPVATNRENVPKYVLTDNEGNILQFVTPRAGMNLQRYERQRVGIYGDRGYLPNVNQPILTADRIISMDRVR